MSIYFFVIVNIGIYKTIKGGLMLAFYLLYLERCFSTVLCFIIVSLCKFIKFCSMVCNHRESGGSASGGQRDEPKGAVKINRHKNRAPPLQVLSLHSLSLSPARFLKFQLINNLQISYSRRFINLRHLRFSMWRSTVGYLVQGITSSHSLLQLQFSIFKFSDGSLSDRQ